MRVQGPCGLDPRKETTTRKKIRWELMELVNGAASIHSIHAEAINEVEKYEVMGVIAPIAKEQFVKGPRAILRFRYSVERSSTICLDDPWQSKRLVQYPFHLQFAQGCPRLSHTEAGLRRLADDGI